MRLQYTIMKSWKSKDYLALYFRVIVLILFFDLASTMTAEEKMKAKEHVVELFYHTYTAYMENAYPADELMPLSCKGRWRGSEPSRGDVDDTLGNFTLTLIDSVDTLAVLGDVEGFEEAVLNIIKDARFDCDVIVSVFETNIRILGGLLGGHVMASYFKRRGLGMRWYNDELLTRAKEVGDRLLPAFNTSTGIPYPRINLKHGIVPQISNSYHDTCTACAGSMILEFAALSRLTGIAVYEEKARKAMDYLWQQRHRSSDLMGLIINIHNGDWIRRESGVGAGIDSYYEYVLKAYILLGDDSYLDRFNKHYDAVMRYVSQGPLLMDVHMHKPHAISRNFMDALLAFWPGLQVLKGDLVPAIETHEMLYQVLQRHNFIPEAFTTDFRVHWSHHPLRPEFIESTYFLYKATGDHYYLEVGKHVLDNLEAHARVPCGLAAIKNVKTGAHEDQLDSYVLAEMFKYLFLLFTEKEDLKVDIDDFIFTTEAHLLPLSLSIGNLSSSVPKIRREAYAFKVDITPPVSDSYVTTTARTASEKGSGPDEGSSDDEEENTILAGENMCPALHTTHEAGPHYPRTVRSQIQHIVSRANPQRKNRTPRLRASDFIAGNKEQLDVLHAMGIRIATMSDGRVQLLHTASEALSPEDAEDGMQFMQEMIELSRLQQQQPQHDPMFVHVSIPGLRQTETLRAGPAQFGYSLKEKPPVTAMLAIARPFRACKEIENGEELSGHIVLLERGDCMFIDKARNLQRVGARGGIVLDQTLGSSSESQPLFAMSGDGTNDVTIPLVFLYHTQGQQLLQLLTDNSFLEVTLTATDVPPSESTKQASGPDLFASTTEPRDIQASSGMANSAEDNPPVPLLDENPKVPPSNAKMKGNGVDDEEDDDDDSFFKHMDDKFYHHEAQLRDLYYLQTGSRYLHVNVEVRPSPIEPQPLAERGNAFSLDVLPDGSKMLTVRLTYQTTDGYEHIKPHLNQLYLDTVHLIQRHTNFDDLPHATDYLRALARCLEAGYFGLPRVDRDALTLIRGLSRQLQYVHVFPSQPERPNIQTQSRTSSGEEMPYAGVEDFVESSSEPSTEFSEHGKKSEGQVQGGGSSQYIRYVHPGDTGYSARVDEEGRLNLVHDPAENSAETGGQRRNTFSVQMSADSEEDISVRITIDSSHISHTQSFSTEGAPLSQDSQPLSHTQSSTEGALPSQDSQPLSHKESFSTEGAPLSQDSQPLSHMESFSTEGTPSAQDSQPKPQPQPLIPSARARDLVSPSSQSGVSGSDPSAASVSYSSQPLGHPEASRDSEGGSAERTAGLSGKVGQGESIEGAPKGRGENPDRTAVLSPKVGEVEWRNEGDRTRDYHDHHHLDDEL